MAFVNLGQIIYPIGSYYISSNSTSPATLFGGSWVEVTGKFLYANKSSNTGGSNTHNHKFTFSYFPYYGVIGCGWNQQPDETLFTFGPTQETVKTTSSDVRFVNSNAAGATKSANTVAVEKTITVTNDETLPAYQSVYCWRRTA